MQPVKSNHNPYSTKTLSYTLPLLVLMHTIYMPLANGGNETTRFPVKLLYALEKTTAPEEEMICMAFTHSLAVSPPASVFAF
ncbi:MAG: hypothetical protein NTZ41_02020 [Sphingobacteriales bacterium]|nr:hypothetical protein [Sphingobacteriales bacterium]